MFQEDIVIRQLEVATSVLQAYRQQDDAIGRFGIFDLEKRESIENAIRGFMAELKFYMIPPTGFQPFSVVAQNEVPIPEEETEAEAVG